MFRLYTLSLLCLLSLLVVNQARAAEGELAGVWKQDTEGIGASFWELHHKSGNHYTAQEYGLGNKKGTAHLEDGHLVIVIEDGDGKGTYRWKLKGTAGDGKLIVKPKEGDEKVFEKSAVRFIGK